MAHEKANPIHPETQRLLKVTAEAGYITVDQLAGKHRLKEYTEPRHCGVYVAYEFLNMHRTMIQKAFGFNNISSVQHAIKTVRDRLDAKDKAFTVLVEKIKKGMGL